MSFDTPYDSVISVVIIPAYEPAESFPAYVRSLTKENISACVVVDDGSGESYAARFQEVAACPKCVVLHHERNQGKGAALKTAFSYCREHFPASSVYATADADGQHLVPDVLRILDAVLESPQGIILGSRNFHGKDVPARSRWGNMWTSLFFRFVHGQKVSDTQTGLRGFSGSLLDWLLSVPGNRFEYEMNMLIHAGHDSIPLHAVTITTVYNEESRHSHFQLFRDSGLVMKAVFGSLGMYFFSSAISAIADVVFFYLLHSFFPLDVAPELRTALAKIVARIGSSVINLYFNFRYVFHGKGAASILRYYILWTLQLSASTGLSILFINVLYIPRILSVIIIDLSLALASYQIQKHWVFRHPAEEDDRS